MTFDHRELATVLAALRFWQRQGPGEAERDIATDGESLKELSAAEIDTLCERLNFGCVDAGD